MRPFDAIHQDPAPAAPPPAPTPQRRAGPRRPAAAVLALAIGASTIAGGAVGGFTAAQWLSQQPSAPAATSSPSQSPSETTLASDIYDRVNPSVVQLLVAGQGRGSGSGFVVDARGYILTNNHVVANARTVTVRFSSGETRQAQVVGTDRGNDLALLKVDLPAGVPAATLGDSTQVKVGEIAIAIGSPFGLAQTMTQGIVSAVGRTWQPSSGPVRQNLIQTDAPINPGNSGGPLLNARGEVIGINSMIESPIQGSVGVGFAVPINVAKQLLPQLEAGAQLEPVWIGISGVPLDANLAAEHGLAVQVGVLVTSIVAGGPAARAGLRGGQDQTADIPRGGDVITAVDGTAVRDVAGISGQLAGRKPGDRVTLSIVRGGERLDVTVTLQAWPAGTG
jgi:S1-C subfamily serine protease